MKKKEVYTELEVHKKEIKHHLYKHNKSGKWQHSNKYTKQIKFQPSTIHDTPLTTVHSATVTMQFTIRKAKKKFQAIN